MIEEIPVPLPGREYCIRVGPGLLSQVGETLARLGQRGRVLLVTNPTVARWYLAPVRESLNSAGFAVHEALVPDGEEYKSLDQTGALYGLAAGARLDRSDAVIALGGGVIGDLAGFVAATYLRGVNFVQLPTTVLAQIDSSIGGKVAVNLPAGKNLVGAFHQPRLVLADIESLRTLPPEEFRAGLIEMLKHGLLDAAYFDWYEENLIGMCRGETALLTDGIAHSCRIKAAIVVEDEREHGKRTLLNLGHTVGHALEKVAGYGVWRHGEAVGLGLIMAGRLSRRLGMLSDVELDRLTRIVYDTLGPRLPVLSQNQVQPLMQALFLDKKTMAGRLRFVLPAEIGRAIVTDSISEAIIHEELSALVRPEVLE